jgi:hypothetical protein
MAQDAGQAQDARSLQVVLRRVTRCAHAAATLLRAPGPALAVALAAAAAAATGAAWLAAPAAARLPVLAISDVDGWECCKVICGVLGSSWCLLRGVPASAAGMHHDHDGCVYAGCMVCSASTDVAGGDAGLGQARGMMKVVITLQLWCYCWV